MRFIVAALAVLASIALGERRCRDKEYWNERHKYCDWCTLCATDTIGEIRPCGDTWDRICNWTCSDPTKIYKGTAFRQCVKPTRADCPQCHQEGLLKCVAMGQVNQYTFIAGCLCVEGFEGELCNMTVEGPSLTSGGHPAVEPTTTVLIGVVSGVGVMCIALFTILFIAWRKRVPPTAADSEGTHTRNIVVNADGDIEEAVAYPISIPHYPIAAVVATNELQEAAGSKSMGELDESENQFKMDAFFSQQLRKKVFVGLSYARGAFSLEVFAEKFGFDHFDIQHMQVNAAARKKPPGEVFLDMWLERHREQSDLEKMMSVLHEMGRLDISEAIEERCEEFQINFHNLEISD